MSFFKRTQKEKRIHYTQVANRTKPVKAGSKFTEAEQRAYAAGQRDARNESARITKFKHSTPQEREVYKKKKAAERAAYRAAKAAEKAATEKAKNAKKAAKKSSKNGKSAGEKKANYHIDPFTGKRVAGADIPNPDDIHGSYGGLFFPVDPDKN